jgi:hypothetical protein
MPDGTLRLMQRGNGKGGADAFIDVNAAALFEALAHDGKAIPALAVTRLSLGATDGVRLTPTDLARRGDGLVFVAAAEDSPNAVDDGAVVGAAVGVLDGGTAKWARLVDESGRPLTDKPEGICADATDASKLWLVTASASPARRSRRRTAWPWTA